ncbi:MAG TPA: NUDIX domain-containing protein [Candidatus Dormibacteraeota bacterium]
MAVDLVGPRMRVTWDGQPIAEDPPTGAVIAVFRRRGERVEWLVLHRAQRGPDYDGEWAWGAPSGCRLPGEPVEACARRELLEETGLDLTPAPVLHDEHWPVFAVQAPPAAVVRLSAEHDAHRWVDLATAGDLVKPDFVAEQVRRVAELLGRSPG